MTLYALGINHNTAPVALREQISFDASNLCGALSELKAEKGVHEAAILSTCNRTEIYCNINAANDELIALNWLSRYHNIALDKLNPFLYRHPDINAVKHMLRVASGLDSMVLGEPQVLGQLKTAYQYALDADSIGQMLNKLFQHSFHVAKQVRTDTDIANNPVSVAYAAVRLGQQIFGKLENQTALLIGAGETIELAASHLHENQLGRMIIANRTLERSQVLAERFGGFAISIADIPKHLADVDIIISSTASQLPLLGKGAVETAFKKRKSKPMFMVDIAVPRDIEPEVGELEDVYLYTVDDLKDIIDENLKNRQEAAKQAEYIVNNQAVEFMHWIHSLNSVDTIKAIREQAKQTQATVLAESLKKLEQNTDAEKVLENALRNLTNKLLHTPSSQLRAASEDDREDLLKAARELFDINSKNDQRNS